MLTVSSLDPLNLPLNLSDFDLVLSDLDSTLLDFEKGHQEAMKLLTNMLDEDYAGEVKRIHDLVVQGLHLSLDNKLEQRKEFEEIRHQIKEVQPSWSEFGIRCFSRLAWLLLAAKKLKKQIDYDALVKAQDAYWISIAYYANVYPDAKKLYLKLKELDIPIVIMTGSDSVLTFNKNGILIYDPEYSREYKLKRIKYTKLFFDKIVTGDPIDKPEQKFFETVFEEINKIGTFEKRKILAIGDSFRYDLEVPEQLGCETVLIKR